MNQFKIIPTIYLYNGQAVDKDNKTLLGDAVELATLYGNLGADAVLLFDISSNDKEHEENISTMIQISDNADIETIVGGNAKRLEDVKKYLYSGAIKAFLDMSDESNRELVKETSDRFGSDKIAVMVSEEFDFSQIEQIKANGVSLIIADGCVDKCKNCGIDVLALQDDFSYESVKSISSYENIYGICSKAFDNTTDFYDIKLQLKEQGICTNIFEAKFKFSDFKLNDDGMIPVIVQDYKTNEVLMLAYMNEEAFDLTIKTGKMTYYSRSRNEIWVKGETSGHYQYVKELSMDCDLDTMLAKVHQIGVPCHTGAKSCFFNELIKKDYDSSNPMKVFEEVYQVILDRKENPKEGSYTNYLFDKGIDKILKKVGEEATEIVIAAKNPDAQEIKYEISDFLYHVMVLMAEKGVSWKEITKELSRR